MKTINVVDLSKLELNENFKILDVRTDGEFEFCNLGGVHIPLDQLENRIIELDKDKTYYCLCHHGVRSAYATQFLMHAGFKDVINIEGGIDAWSLQVDPEIKRY